MKKLFLLGGFIVLGLVVFATPANAQTTEQITSFDSKVLIRHDNSAQIAETIVYDFGTNSRHGIYRDIPIDYADGSTKYYLNFNLVGVWDSSGNKLQTELDTTGGNKRIRIGDPNKTISGVHTYKIGYALSPIVLQKDTTPFLNLDLLGGGWEVPVRLFTAQVKLEGGAGLQDVSWFSNVQNTATTEQNVQGYFTAQNIQPYEAVTINAALPDGYVSTYLEPNKRRAEDVRATIIAVLVGVVVVLTFVGVIGILVARFVRTKARRANQTVIPQYEPPKGLLPAHIGLLQDDKSEGREITATIIDWAVRGYLKIVYIPKKGFFSRKDYQLVSQKDTTDMSEAEAAMFVRLFETGNEVLISKLATGGFPEQAETFKKAVKVQLTSQGFYDKDGAIFMRGTLTESGAKEWAKVDGFRLYLSTVEKDRLAFSDAPEKTPERFNALLPYAIALGVEKQWAKQFEGIDLSQQTTWYAGNVAAFSAVSLASDLGSSFASTVSSNSSAGSGGGSSGGGFGGGGGGSW